MPYGSLMFWSTRPTTMEKQKRRTKTAVCTSLKEREGKGSEWRSASRRCQLQTRTTSPRRHANPPPPPRPRQVLTVSRGGVALGPVLVAPPRGLQYKGCLRCLVGVDRLLACLLDG